VATKWQRSRRRRPPNLEALLAAVESRRTIRLNLTREQKAAFRDRDGRIALDVFRHFVGARFASVLPGEPPERFPLTAFTVQAVAWRLGYEIGEKRCRAMTRRLVEAGIVVESGSYRQRYRLRAGRGSYRVRLLRLAAHALRAVVHRGATRYPRHSPVGNRSSVKRAERRRWWQHPLFGSPDGLPPPHLTRKNARRMRSLDELAEWTW
jgi:hypothetical protein